MNISYFFQGVITNQTLAYYLARIQKFLLKIGIDPKRLRFRQVIFSVVRKFELLIISNKSSLAYWFPLSISSTCAMKWRIMLRIAGMQKYWPHMDGLKLSDVLIDQHLIWETILTLQASIYNIYFARLI